MICVPHVRTHDPHSTTQTWDEQIILSKACTGFHCTLLSHANDTNQLNHETTILLRMVDLVEQSAIVRQNLDVYIAIGLLSGGDDRALYCLTTFCDFQPFGTINMVPQEFITKRWEWRRLWDFLLPADPNHKHSQ